MSISAPERAGAAGRGPARYPGLAVTAAAHRFFPTGTTPIDNPVERSFFPDHTGHAGLDLDLAALDAATGNRFEDMGAELLDLLGAQPETDLMVLAYATPDLLPTTLTAPTLAERLPGRPLLLAVTDQGRSAPFSALALAQSYAHRHGYRRSLVLAFDQAVLPYRLPADGPLRLAGDSAAVLVLEAVDADRPDGYQVRQVCGLEPQQVGRALRDLVAELDPRGTARLLAGPGLETDPGRAVARRAEAGYPCTALLGLLAEGLPDGGPVLLAEYDPVLGDLSVCRVDPAPAR
ncbi:hypothetical protein GCM10009759_15930 [Kitasatospora saccharophila]|uniref:Uncharacterized protein n=1 Tax=Kitasatospora saccharophila TaxID=407973 RepID=A0ABN2WFR2_9ACTN